MEMFFWLVAWLNARSASWNSSTSSSSCPKTTQGLTVAMQRRGAWRGKVHRNEHPSHSFHSYLPSKDTYLELEDFLREQGFISTSAKLYFLSEKAIRVESKFMYFFLNGEVIIILCYGLLAMMLIDLLYTITPHFTAPISFACLQRTGWWWTRAPYWTIGPYSGFNFWPK